MYDFIHPHKGENNQIHFKKQHNYKKKIIEHFGLSKQAISKHLAELINKGEIKKLGKPPQAYYTIKKIEFVNANQQFDSEIDFSHLLDTVKTILGLELPIIEIKKLQTEIIVPQKTLSKPEDRIENAEATFIVLDENKYKKILLIDDFAGSGSSLNFIAKKIKKRSTHNGIIIDGFVFAGSPNGVINNDYKKFEVIKEV